MENGGGAISEGINWNDTPGRLMEKPGEGDCPYEGGTWMNRSESTKTVCKGRYERTIQTSDECGIIDDDFESHNDKVKGAQQGLAPDFMVGDLVYVRQNYGRNDDTPADKYIKGEKQDVNKWFYYGNTLPKPSNKVSYQAAVVLSKRISGKSYGVPDTFLISYLDDTTGWSTTGVDMRKSWNPNNPKGTILPDYLWAKGDYNVRQDAGSNHNKNRITVGLANPQNILNAKEKKGAAIVFTTGITEKDVPFKLINNNSRFVGNLEDEYKEYKGGMNIRKLTYSKDFLNQKKKPDAIKKLKKIKIRFKFQINASKDPTKNPINEQLKTKIANKIKSQPNSLSLPYIL